MPVPALTPQAAVDLLGERSADIRCAVMLDADGVVASYGCDGDASAAELERLARRLLERAEAASARAGGEVGRVEVATATGAVFASWEPEGDGAGTRAIAVVGDRLALPSLVFYDLLMTFRVLHHGAAA